MSFDFYLILFASNQEGALRWLPNNLDYQMQIWRVFLMNQTGHFCLSQEGWKMMTEQLKL